MIRERILCFRLFVSSPHELHSVAMERKIHHPENLDFESHAVTT